MHFDDLYRLRAFASNAMLGAALHEYVLSVAVFAGFWAIFGTVVVVASLFWLHGDAKRLFEEHVG